MSVTGLITQQIKALACGRTTAVQVAAWADALFVSAQPQEEKQWFYLEWARLLDPSVSWAELRRAVCQYDKPCA